MIREELGLYGGNDGYKLAIKMAKIVQADDEKPPEDKAIKFKCLEDNLMANALNTEINEKSVQVCFKENKRFDLKTNKHAIISRLSSRENSLDDHEPVIKYVDN